MKLKNLSARLLLIFGVAVIGYSCKKVDTPEPMGDAGNTIVKLVADEDNYNLLSIDVVSTSQGINLLEIRRDIPSEGELNKSMVVVIKQDAAVLSDFNTAHGTSYVAFPADKYTVDASNPRSGTDFTVTFNPGEFVKYLKVVVPNATAIDLTKSYAFGFTISSVDGGGKISSVHKKAVVEVGLKNKYDGVYSIISGNVIRYTAPGAPANDALSGSVVGQPDLILTTTGPNTVEITNLKWANGQGVAGIENLRATVDPVTNLVTMQSLVNATLTNWAGKENKYDPATRTFYLAFRWNPTSTVREYELVIRYNRAR